MIKVEGYKAFVGKMELRTYFGETIQLDGQFLYKPDTKCWYNKGSSCPEEMVVNIVEDYLSYRLNSGS